jgi:hypothetical protein
VIGCVYIPGVDVCAGTELCPAAVTGDTFGRTFVTGCVYTFVDGFTVLAAGCGCTVFAGCLWIFVCAALGADAGGACR